MKSTAAKRTRKEPAQRRAEIIEVAVALADEIGLDRLTGRDIAARMGVAPGLLHHYFPQIDDLIVEAFRHVVTTDIEQLADGLDDLPATEALTEFRTRSLARRREAVLALWMSAWVTASRRPKLAREVDRQMAAGVDLLARVIDKGRRAREFATDDSAQSAWRILVTLAGIAVQRSIRPATQRADDLSHVVREVAERELDLSAGTLANDTRE
ncbi:MAG: TetR family transcriptional regulator [Streptosporangiales bacterium]|nr:TetR family transcriptional regulator [Streptosporangiales bacterium]